MRRLFWLGMKVAPGLQGVALRKIDRHRHGRHQLPRGCRMTLEDGLARAGRAQRTVHPAILRSYDAYVAAGILSP